METPVLYFYGPRDASANVKVLFPKGIITEWYPKASVSRTSDAIEWQQVRVTLNAKPDFPTERGRSHYYAARETAALPLEVGGQKEKFLFYRGAGAFPLPIAAKVAAGGDIILKNLGVDPVNEVVLFQNRGGDVTFQIDGVFNGFI